MSAVYLKRSDCNNRQNLEGDYNNSWEKHLPPSHVSVFSIQILVIFEIFKLSLSLSLMHLRAQIACCE